MLVDECVIKARPATADADALPSAGRSTEPWAGPTGAMAAAAGDIVLVGNHDTNNLVDFKFKPHWKGERGEHGQGRIATVATAAPPSCACHWARS